MSQPRVPKSNPKGLILWGSNVIHHDHHAGPLNPPHVPAPSPSQTLKVSFSGALSDPLFGAVSDPMVL